MLSFILLPIQSPFRKFLFVGFNFQEKALVLNAFQTASVYFSFRPYIWNQIWNQILFEIIKIILQKPNSDDIFPFILLNATLHVFLSLLTLCLKFNAMKVENEALIVLRGWPIKNWS